MASVNQQETSEYYWIQYLRQRVRQNKNFLGILAGQTGSGKSWTGLSIGEMVDPNFSIDRVIFTGKELMALINSGKLKSGSCIVWDEAGIDLSNRNWQSLTNKMLNFLMQTFRHKNLILLFTTPYGDFVDSATRKLFHGEFKTQGIDFEKRKVRIKPLLLQYNSDLKKFYKKHLRVLTPEGYVPLVEWNVPAPSPELVKQYEIKKNNFTAELNKKIALELEKLDMPKGRRQLTEIQESIFECWELGILKQKDIASKLNLTQPSVSEYEGFMHKKGYSKPKQEEYKGILGVAPA